MSDLFNVRRGLGSGFGSNSAPPALLTSMAQIVVVDFLTAAILDGRGYQVRIGTVTTPLTGDIDITDTDAEACADAGATTVIMPIYLNADVESLNGGTLPTIYAKSVTVVSNAGTAFTPLPLKSNGPAAVSTARVDAAGVVQVPAELATNTVRHFGKTVATAALEPLADHEFRPPPVLVGARCFYVQVAGITAGPLYFASFDYLEYQAAMIDP